jgi:hypothetical protein
MLFAMADQVITCEEVIALLFNVSDIAVALAEVRQVLRGNGGEEEADES